MGRKGEGNRQRIIDAADKLFSDRGYHKTSFQDISEATDIPRGNFYYYFKTKDDILDAVVKKRSESLQCVLDEIEASVDSPLERLMRFVEMLDMNASDILHKGCPIGSLSSELAKDSEALQMKARVVFERMRDWLTEQFSALSQPQPEDLALDLLGKMQGVTIIACAFQDSVYLQRNLKAIQQWLLSQVGKQAVGNGHS